MGENGLDTAAGEFADNQSFFKTEFFGNGFIVNLTDIAGFSND